MHISLSVFGDNTVTQHHIPEQKVYHAHCCQTLKAQFKCVSNEPYLCLVQSFKIRTKLNFYLVLFHSHHDPSQKYIRIFATENTQAVLQRNTSSGQISFITSQLHVLLNFRNCKKYTRVKPNFQVKL